jgi:hypothetical protein
MDEWRIWMTERDKMLAGELYNPLDPDLVAARVRARDLCQSLNQTRESDQELRRGLLSDLFGAASIVTRDIPAGVFAPGNPCRIIRDNLE